MSRHLYTISQQSHELRPYTISSCFTLKNAEPHTNAH